jgi:hypothetical protein
MGLPCKFPQRSHAAGPAESRRGTIPGRPQPAALPPAAAAAAGKDPAVARAGTAARPARATLLSTGPCASSPLRREAGAVPGIRVAPPPGSGAVAGNGRDMTVSGPGWRLS